MWRDKKHFEAGKGKTIEMIRNLWNTLRRLRRWKCVVIGGLRVMLLEELK
jgi:hypothetical protein